MGPGPARPEPAALVRDDAIKSGETSCMRGRAKANGASLVASIWYVCMALAWSGTGRATTLPEGEVLAARPGQLIRVWPLEGGGLEGARAYRILYRSTGLNGEPIPVTAAIMFPDRPAPAHGRPVVAWAHPTSGVATKCAPSLLPITAAWLPG